MLMSNKLHEQADLLDRPHDAHCRGTAPPPMSPQMREELLSDRFIREDEFGTIPSLIDAYAVGLHQRNHAASGQRKGLLGDGHHSGRRSSPCATRS
jgi:hypothetical protein